MTKPSENIADTIKTLALSTISISFLGWCWEMFYSIFIRHSPNDRGFLILPLCPIYGIAVLLIYIALKTPHQMHIFGKDVSHLHPICRYLLYFVLTTALVTLFELLIGCFFGEILHVKLWNYKNTIKYISLSSSLIWGVGITAFMRFIYAPLLNAIGKWKPRLRNILFWVLLFFITADAVFNFSHILILGKWFNFNQWI